MNLPYGGLTGALLARVYLAKSPSHLQGKFMNLPCRWDGDLFLSKKSLNLPSFTSLNFTKMKTNHDYDRPFHRPQWWDYSSPGSYFITICIQNRERLLGHIDDGEMHLSPYGEIVRDEILKIPDYHARAELGEWVIMPDHIHCMITLAEWKGFDIERPAFRWDSLTTKQYVALRRNMLLPKIIGKFKMLTSKEVNILRGTPGQRTWLHNYNDYIIDMDVEGEYERIARYIRENPQNWKG
jgi:REP element-mobilizing transposase RayT